MIFKKSFKPIILILFVYLFILFNNSPITAKENNYKEIKKQSYEVIAEALYDKNTYTKFKLQMIEMLGKLADPTGQSYLDESMNASPVYSLLKSMMSAVTESMNKTKGGLLVQEDYNIDNKVKSIVDKGDASIAYMLKDALSFPDYTIQLLAATSLMQVREESASPLFLEMLDSKKNQDVIVALNVIGELNSPEAFEKISIIALSKENPPKTRLSAFRALEKLDPKNTVDISKKLIMDPEEDIMQESIAFLASQNDPDGLKKYTELLKNEYSKKKAILYLYKVIKGLQNNGLDIAKNSYKSGKPFDKIMVIDSFRSLNDISVVKEDLLNALNEDDIGVKTKALEVLLDIDDEDVRKSLENISFIDPNAYENPASYIITKKNKKHDSILKAFTEKASPKTQITIAEYFLENKREQDFAKKVLVKFLNNENPQIKTVVAILLLENGYTEGYDIVNEASKSTDSGIKAKSIVTLANYGDKKVVPLLETSISNNKNVNNTFGAALLLNNLGNKDHINIIENYLAQENITSIDKQFVDINTFKGFLNNNDPMVRLNAAITLYEIGEKSYLDNVIELLNNENVKVRGKAVKFLGEKADKSVVDNIQKLLNDNYVRVRVNASEALLRIINREKNMARS